jgi:hypothetical protein
MWEMTMNETKPMRGKVARILNTRELVINLGDEQGVAVGMRFDVLDQKEEDIKDPDTNEVLGSIERPKVRVKVTNVLDRMCIASTYKKTEVNIGGRGIGIGDFSRILMPPKLITKYQTLKTEEKTWEDLSEAESYVKIGDPVVQVICNEEED